MNAGQGWYYCIGMQGKAQGLGGVKMTFEGIGYFPRLPKAQPDSAHLTFIGPYGSFSEARRRALRAFTSQADLARGELAKVRDLRLMDIEGSQ